MSRRIRPGRGHPTRTEKKILLCGTFGPFRAQRFLKPRDFRVNWAPFCAMGGTFRDRDWDIMRQSETFLGHSQVLRRRRKGSGGRGMAGRRTGQTKGRRLQDDAVHVINAIEFRSGCQRANVTGQCNRRSAGLVQLPVNGQHGAVGTDDGGGERGVGEASPKQGNPVVITSESGPNPLDIMDPRERM